VQRNSMRLRPAYSQEALRMMQHDSAGTFDPTLFGIFRYVLQRGGL
jgi:HD-GYP domain-containing protein (c-di-GMP phosphodiesterase class II)